MLVSFNNFYYTISCSEGELKLEPLVLSNYVYSKRSFIPKLVVDAKRYVLKGQAVQGEFISTVSCEYPYYYYANNLFINFKGEVEQISAFPKVFKGFVDSNRNIIVSNVDNFPKPLDIIKVGANTYELNSGFTFAYDFQTKQMVVVSIKT